jgi:hypothetical protein
MSTRKETNLNILTINRLRDINDNEGKITINNTIKIPYTGLTTFNKNDNANACILMKDINSNGSGTFYKLNVNSSINNVPHLYFNNNVIINSSNLLQELENILIYYPLETSNIIVTGGYINFFNGSIPNTTQGANGVGIRYSSNNTVQFKNYDTNWIDLVDITKHDQFVELIDVDVHTTPLANNQYIIYNALSNMYVNSNLAIFNDKSPTLGGNLAIGTNILQFGSTSNRLTFNANVINNNNLLVLTNKTSVTGAVNYLEITNADIDINTNPEIICRSNISPDVGLNITTKGSGDLNLNVDAGNVYVNSDSLVISGIVKNSIYRTSSKVGGYLPVTPWIIPITTDTILFDFVNGNTAGTYWANVTAGIEGQKLNLIYNNKGSSTIDIQVNFGTNGLITGSGLLTGLHFDTSGQSASLVYLGGGIDAWQILNTGSSVF